MIVIVILIVIVIVIVFEHDQDHDHKNDHENEFVCENCVIPTSRYTRFSLTVTRDPR